MKKHVFVALGLATILMSGCVTQSIQQGKDLSTSGIRYTEAVDKLLDVTVDRIIDFDTEELKKTRRGSDLEGIITQKNEALSDQVTEIERFRTHTKLLKTYFLNLQALADLPIKEDAKGAVQSLSNSFKTLNETLELKVQLTEDQITQIGTFGGLAANTIHAAKIKRALVRDAKVIGKYLALQENQLKTITEVLTDLFSNDNDLFLNEKVIAPYVDMSQPLGTEWASNRKQWLKSQLVIQQLETAIEAAKQLRGVWADILQGRTDINSLSVLISDVNEFVTTLEAFKAADKTK
jgi:hypothetical protein